MEQGLDKRVAVTSVEHPDFMLLDGSAGGFIGILNYKVRHRGTLQVRGMFNSTFLFRTQTGFDSFQSPCSAPLVRDCHGYLLLQWLIVGNRTIQFPLVLAARCSKAKPYNFGRGRKSLSIMDR